MTEKRAYILFHLQNYVWFFSGTDYSFFGIEWQKRWCALSHHTFYYYGSEKGNSVCPRELRPRRFYTFCTVNGTSFAFCNQTSSRRASSTSMATPSKSTAAYGKTRKRTAALKFQLQTSESTRYAHLSDALEFHHHLP